MTDKQEQPVAWVIPGRDNARADGFIDAMAWEEGEFTKPLYATRTDKQEQDTAASGGWIKIPDEPPLELLKSINVDNQVLAYENGRYYNAWFTFEVSEGGWFWTDDADSEPNPSHYRALPSAPVGCE